MSSLGPLQHVGPAHLPMPVPAPAPPPPTASASSIERWIATHRKALAYTAGGLALLGAGVAGYRYYYASQRAADRRSALDGGSDEEATAGSSPASAATAAAKDKKRRKKKASKEKKGVNDEDGPLLEEVEQPAVAKQANDDGAKSPAVGEDKKDGASCPAAG